MISDENSMCVKLHTVCEITQCAQNYIYSKGKNSCQLKNFSDCRGVVMSTKQNPDGYCVTRQAKLSMHEIPHSVVHEFQPMEIK